MGYLSRGNILDFSFATSFVSSTRWESKGTILANALNTVILLDFLEVKKTAKLLTWSTGHREREENGPK
jgi:hypothetical protein